MIRDEAHNDWWQTQNGSHRHKISSTLPQKLGLKHDKQFIRILHRLRVGCALTKYQLHKYDSSISPTCSSCHQSETIEHILLYCGRYHNERQTFMTTTHLSMHDMTLTNVLGTTTKEHLIAIKNFLTSTGLLYTL